MVEIAVILGGALGAISRYLCGVMLGKRFEKTSIPLAMIIVNILGSFCLGLFLAYHQQHPVEGFYFNFTAIGFLGAFTTFSTFSNESTVLIQQKRWKDALTYIICSIGGSISFFVLGYVSFTSFY